MLINYIVVIINNYTVLENNRVAKYLGKYRAHFEKVGSRSVY